MSASLILHALVFIIVGNYRRFWEQVSQHRFLLLLIVFLGLHALSLLWSENLDSGWDGIRVRLSMIALPILYTGTLTFNLDNTRRWAVLLLLSVFVIIGMNVGHYFWLKQQNQALDIRQLSWFGSHIRFGILVGFSGMFALLLWQRKNLNSWLFYGYILLITGYTVFSQTLSGILSLGVAFAFIIIFFIRKNRFFIGVAALGLSGVIIGGIILLKTILTPSIPCGSFIKMSLAKEEWKKHSDFPLDSLDRKGQPLQRTAERYLCSKQLPLTEGSIKALLPHEITHIENGFTSKEAAEGRLLSRIEELKFQLYEAKDPNGHSLLQRLAYWKTAWAIIKDHPIIGVGIGDVDHAFKAKYESMGSPLLPENQRRSHNLFLTTWLAIGVFGFISLVVILCWLSWISLRDGFPLLLSFCIINTLTMLLEDSIETQAGASFFGFFVAILISREARKAWTTKIY